jgi:hypothetical protein
MKDLLNTRKTMRLIRRKEIPDIFGIQEPKVVILAAVASANAKDFPATRSYVFGKISRRPIDSEAGSREMISAGRISNQAQESLSINFYADKKDAS